MEDEPPDPERVRNDSFSLPIDNVDPINRKRAQVSNVSAHPQKIIITDPDQQFPSVQSSYTHPDFINKKVKYSQDDTAPFLVHVNKKSNDQVSGVTLKPIKFGHFLYHNNIKNIVSDGVKKVGRNRISVEFKTAADANTFIDHPALQTSKYEATIPSYNITRMGLVRQVPIEWTLEELIAAIEIPSGYGAIIKARRLNRRSVSDSNNISWIPTQTVVLTFSGQKLPSHIYCFYTSMPVEKYVLPLIQCHKCCRFGHVTSQCRSSPRCFVCAQNHEGLSCTRQTPTCLFCSGPHTAKDPTCPEHLRQKSIKLVMSQENIAYSEAAARFPFVRRSFADTTRSPPRNTSQQTPYLTNDSFSTPTAQPSQSTSYKKTIFIPQRTYRQSLNSGYDKAAHQEIVENPTLSLPNGCALLGNDNISNNDNFCELMISMLINMISRFSDAELPLSLRQKLTQLTSITSNIHNSTMELSEYQT